MLFIILYPSLLNSYVVFNTMKFLKCNPIDYEHYGVVQRINTHTRACLQTQILLRLHTIIIIIIITYLHQIVEWLKRIEEGSSISCVCASRYAICANVLIVTLSGEHKRQKASLRHVVVSADAKRRRRRGSLFLSPFLCLSFYIYMRPRRAPHACVSATRGCMRCTSSKLPALDSGVVRVSSPAAASPGGQKPR